MSGVSNQNASDQKRAKFFEVFRSDGGSQVGTFATAERVARFLNDRDLTEFYAKRVEQSGAERTIVFNNSDRYVVLKKLNG